MIIIDKQSELTLLAKSIFAGVATADDFKHVDPKEVLAIKSGPEPRTLFQATEKAVKGEGDRVRRFIASTERADRSGDIVRVKGWDFADFRKNPMAVWCHMTRDLPIGLVGEFNKATKEDPPKLYETIDFHTEETYPFADQVLRLVDVGGLRTVSVSFIPLAGGVKVPSSPEERDAMGLGPWGVEYVKQSQLELSVCVVPAQPDALATKQAISKAIGEMVAAKQISEAHAKELLAATEGPKVFAVAHASKENDDGEAVGAAKTPLPETNGELGPVLASLNTTLEALTKKLTTDEARDARINALERQLSDIKTKANGAPVAPVKQEPEAVNRADASAFYAALTTGLEARKN